MANRFTLPFSAPADATGAPYAGGSLTFYASGTTTLLNTYSDKALTIANTNPVVLDSAGRFPNVFLQNLAYKVVLADANNNPIWTADPVYASDYSTVAQFQSGNGSPNGSVAGSAGSSTIPASSYWDATNNILYVCTQTGTTSTAVWTAVNSSSSAAVVPQPQGYLTPVSGTPVITSDSAGVSNIYYTPFVGNLIPIYNGTAFVPTVFSEISIALVANHAASTLYDLFVFNNSGVLTLVTGPAWSVSTAGSCARGSGAGTTQLSRLSGLWVNTVSMTGRNGSTTYAVPANQGTYVGSLFVDTVAGQVTCHRSYGQSRKWGIWNAYNRTPIYLKAGDSTATWSYTNTTTIRPANNATANSLTIFAGLPEEIFELRCRATTFEVALTGQHTAQAGIGYNSTTAFTGTTALNTFTGSGGNPANFDNPIAGQYSAPPAIGINVITALEATAAAGAVSSWRGTETNMVLSAQWRG